jgi:site-specific DNA-methyltransferase (adenine-specific)
MAAKLQWIDLDQIDDHPKNPRVVMRQDVIDAIAACLIDDGFSEKHAIHVRPVGDRFQILSGHHRRRAAEQVRLDKVPCWVEEMDDDAAYMALATSNNQGELAPLEIGLHALRIGKGSKWSGSKAKDYAKSIGKAASTVSEYKAGAEVFDAVVAGVKFAQANWIDKAKHLNAIHDLPRCCWQTACEWMLEKKCTVEKVEDQVSRTNAALKKVTEEYQWLFPTLPLFSRIAATPDFSASSVESIVALCKSVEAFIADCKTLTKENVEAFWKWVKSEVAGDSWNRRALQKKIEELEALAEQNALDIEASWCLGDFRQHIASLKDSTVSLLLTDPPYGMDYQSGRRAEKHQKIAEDGGLDAAQAAVTDCLELMRPKLQDNAHVLIFCRWDSEHLFATKLAEAGYTVKGSLVWVKNNHGSGDLKGGFAPKHERILHAVKGTPQLHQREPDVLECDKVDTADHPTEKPVELLAKLIEATTVKNQIVVDPFGGVASTCVAAIVTGRRFFGCELDKDYYAKGKERLVGCCKPEEVEA